MQLIGRYEYYGFNGKQWTDWLLIEKSNNVEHLNTLKNQQMEISKSIDKTTKLKHEFKIIKDNS